MKSVIALMSLGQNFQMMLKRQGLLEICQKMLNIEVLDVRFAEMKAEYPDITNLLSKLQQNSQVDYYKLCNIISQLGYTDDKMDNLIESLFKHKYLVGVNEPLKEVYSDLDELKKALGRKRYWFQKPKIMMIVNSRYLDFNKLYKKILKLQN
jgi:hypothetical protein